MPGAAGKRRRYTRLPDLQPDLPDPCGEPAGSTRCGPIAEWDALDQEVFEVQHTLPGSDVETYRLVIETCAQRNRELRPVVDRYMAK